MTIPASSSDRVNDPLTGYILTGHEKVAFPLIRKSDVGEELLVVGASLTPDDFPTRIVGCELPPNFTSR